MQKFKVILGVLLIIGGLQELLGIILNIHSWRDWPFGVEIGFAFLIYIAYLLIKSGLKKKDQLTL
jgi:hypothetical protein